MLIFHRVQSIDEGAVPPPTPPNEVLLISLCEAAGEGGEVMKEKQEANSHR